MSEKIIGDHCLQIKILGLFQGIFLDVNQALYKEKNLNGFGYFALDLLHSILEIKHQITQAVGGELTKAGWSIFLKILSMST